jgi:hypothetical protein
MVHFFGAQLVILFQEDSEALNKKNAPVSRGVHIISIKLLEVDPFPQPFQNHTHRKTHCRTNYCKDHRFHVVLRVDGRSHGKHRAGYGS